MFKVKTKRILSILITFIMLFVVTAPVFALESVSTLEIEKIQEKGGTILKDETVNKEDNESEMVYEGEPIEEASINPENLGEITIAVERFTLGQGYFIEPMKMPIVEGDTGATIIDRLLGKGNYQNSGTIESSFYLESIKDGDTGILDIPKYIQDASGMDNINNDGNDDEFLGQFDYNRSSGWMYAVNNTFLSYGFSDYVPTDGDVIRVQFTLYGLGADLGQTGFGDESLIPSNNKDLLTALIAEINKSNTDLVGTVEYMDSVDVLKNLESNQSQINDSYTKLLNILEGNPIDPEEPEEDPEVDTVIDMIAKLPTPESYTKEDKEAILKVSEIYNRLTVAQKLKVSNSQKLEILLKLANTPEEEPDPEEKPKPEVPEKITDISQALKANTEYIYQNTPEPMVSSIGGEWAILNLGRRNYPVSDDYYAGYYSRLSDTLKEKNGILSGDRKFTEYSRVVIGLSAIGQDPTNVSGYNLLKKLGDYDSVCKQGINGPIFALIALDTKDYEIPDVSGEVKTQGTRQLYIDHILSLEIQTGGFAMSGKVPDPDITGMALQALAKYKDQSNVKAAIDRGVSTLSKLQKANAGYSSWGTDNAESVVQVVVGLTALGIDPVNDPRFIKNNRNLMDALMEYYIEGGGFKHVSTSTKPDGMATEQGGYGLIAYDRFTKGESSLYDMKDKPTEEDPPPYISPTSKPGGNSVGGNTFKPRGASAGGTSAGGTTAVGKSAGGTTTVGKSAGGTTANPKTGRIPENDYTFILVTGMLSMCLIGAMGILNKEKDA